MIPLGELPGGAALEKKPAPERVEFMFDAQAWLDRLEQNPPGTREREGQEETWRRRIHAYRLVRLDGLRAYDLAAESHRRLGKQVTIRSITGWIASVEHLLGSIMGPEYERWWEARINAGYRHEGLRAAPVLSVERGGGTTAAPDLVVTYADNHVDVWSLKCYHARPEITFALDPAPPRRSSFAPELELFKSMYAKRKRAEKSAPRAADLPPRPRLCIAYRDLGLPGGEYFRTFERAEPGHLPSTLSFSHREVGQPTALRWVQGGDTRGPARTAVGLASYLPSSTHRRGGHPRPHRGRRFKGVYPIGPGRWKAGIGTAGGGTKWLGNFASEEEAAAAYDRAAIERWGPSAHLNNPPAPPHATDFATTVNTTKEQGEGAGGDPPVQPTPTAAVVAPAQEAEPKPGGRVPTPHPPFVLTLELRVEVDANGVRVTPRAQATSTNDSPRRR